MINWVEIANIFKEILETGSTNGKKSIIRAHSDNEDMKIILRLTYDPYIRFHIKRVIPKASILKRVPIDHDYTIDHFIDDLDKLVERELTGDAAVEWVAQIYATLPYEFQPYLEKILSKDLKIGLASGLINDVFSGLIPEFKVPLCERFKKIKVHNIKYPVYVEPKIDGVRALAFVTSEGVEIKARSGIVFNNFRVIEEELKNCYKQFASIHGVLDRDCIWSEGFVIDGEIQDEHFQNTMKNARRLYDVNTDDAIYKIWDMMPIKEFLEEESSLSLKHRKEWLLTVISNHKYYNTHLILIPWDDVYDFDRILEVYDYHRAKGEEGVIVKDPNSQYFYKRHRNWFKLKPQDVEGDKSDYSAQILEVYPGDPNTKYANTLGGFKCVIPDYCYDKDDPGDMHHLCEVNFSVGSGFSDIQRAEFWSKKEELIGKWIDIESQEVTLNKNGLYSLRFPIFKGFRGDL